MNTEEFDALKEGDVVWYFEITLSTAGNVSRQLIAKLEKRKDSSFYIVEVEKGTSWREGRMISFWRDGYEVSYHLFKTYNDGIDYWNSVLLNNMDCLTSKYEQAIKRIKGKLLKKND